MKEKTIEVPVEKWSSSPVKMIKFTDKNCLEWGIKPPKIGQKIKLIVDW